MSDLRKLLDECTVGPWEITDRKITKHGGAYDLISGLIWDDFARVAVRFDYDDADSPTGIANARLIALAPDLADALLNAEEALEFYGDKDLDGYDVGVTNYGLSTEVGKIIKDGGERAHVALAEIRKLTGGK